MYADPRQIWRDLSPMMLPPDRVSVTESSEQNVIIATPGGYNGPWETPPYMKRPMDLVGGRQYQGIVFMGPAQSAKTFGLVDCLIHYNIKHVHADMLVVHPTESLTRDFSKGRATRVIRHSGLEPQIVLNNVDSKLCKAGNTLYFGHPTPAQLSGKTLRIVVMSDYDRMPDDVGGEGSAWHQAFNRIKTFLSRGKCIAESSPGGRVRDPKARVPSTHHYMPAQGITSLYHMGTMEQWYWPCPDCGEYFQCRPSFDESTLYIPEVGEDIVEAAEQSRLICPNNGCLVDIHSHRYEMNQRGCWVGFGQTIDRKGRLHGGYRNTDIASFGLAGYAAAFQNPSSLVLEYIKAKLEYDRSGDEQDLMTVTNTQMGAPYISLRNLEGNQADELGARSEALGKRVVPRGVLFLMASVDIQGGKKARFVVQVVGYGVGLESWLVDRYNIRWIDEEESVEIDPAHQIEHWSILIEKVISRSYPVDDESGRELPVLLTAIDHGGEAGVSDMAYQFYRSLKEQRLQSKVMLVKGASRPQAQKMRVTYPDNTSKKKRNVAAKGDVPLWLLDTNRFKDQVSNNLGRDLVGPGYMHFPDWLGEWFFNELTYEVRTASGWSKPGGGANEAFDLYVYNRAAVIKKGGEKINWENPPGWARDWHENTEIIDPRQAAEKPKQKPAKYTRRTRFRFKT